MPPPRPGAPLATPHAGAPARLPQPRQGPPGIKLYEFVKAASGAASWALLTGHAAPRFYDANGESERRGPEWMLEVRPAMWGGRGARQSWQQQPVGGNGRPRRRRLLCVRSSRGAAAPGRAAARPLNPNNNLPHTPHPKIDAGDIDARADEALQYVADRPGRRVTFAAAGRLYALKFPSDKAFRDFMEELEVGVGVWGVLFFGGRRAGRLYALKFPATRPSGTL
jgi:hypothetical protein